MSKDEFLKCTERHKQIDPALASKITNVRIQPTEGHYSLPFPCASAPRPVTERGNLLPGLQLIALPIWWFRKKSFPPKSLIIQYLSGIILSSS